MHDVGVGARRVGRRQVAESLARGRWLTTAVRVARRIAKAGAGKGNRQADDSEEVSEDARP